MKAISILFAFGAIGSLLTSCVPTPGEGGRASIQGHVEEEARVSMFDPSTAYPPYPATDHNVFIVYGDNVGPDEQVETNAQGDFIFPWLRPGEYTVYTYSEDTLGLNPPRDMVVSQTITIESKGETVVLDTLRIFKDL